jgi:NAD(P)-dependent dehydrogenase (short-subunit alcohol dehydrogenase family)
MTPDRSGAGDGAVIVTGAAGGIGAALVGAFAAAGRDVLALDLPEHAEAGRALCRRAGGRAAFVAADVTDDADLDAAVAVAVERSGGVAALVNNAAVYAGLGAKRPLVELTTDDWDRVLRVNVRGVWQATRAVVAPMTAAGGGRIVNISSSTARAGATGFAHYVASKAAVEGLTRAAARELGPAGLTVNCVAPGLVSDEATASLNAPGYAAAFAGRRAIAREMVPEDLVGTIAWLASPAGAFVTGQTVVVDGGLTIA